MIILIISIMLPLKVFAVVPCPFGYINDPLPGLCARYIDQNQDNLCDHSQSQLAISNQPLNSNPKVNKIQTDYYFWQIIVLVLLLYGFGQYLVLLAKETQIKWLKGVTAVKVNMFFNCLLFISFLLSFLTGLLLLFYMLGWLDIEKKIVDLHVEFSLVFSIISLLHIIRHWRYFLRIFKL